MAATQKGIEAGSCLVNDLHKSRERAHRNWSVVNSATVGRSPVRLSHLDYTDMLQWLFKSPKKPVVQRQRSLYRLGLKH